MKPNEYFVFVLLVWGQEAEALEVLELQEGRDAIRPREQDAAGLPKKRVTRSTNADAAGLYDVAYRGFGDYNRWYYVGATKFYYTGFDTEAHLQASSNRRRSPFAANPWVVLVCVFSAVNLTCLCIWGALYGYRRCRGK